MNFFVFLLYYIFATMFFIGIAFLIYKIIMKRKVKAISKLNEQMIEKFFDEY